MKNSILRLNRLQNLLANHQEPFIMDVFLSVADDEPMDLTIVSGGLEAQKKRANISKLGGVSFKNLSSRIIFQTFKPWC